MNYELDHPEIREEIHRSAGSAGACRAQMR